MFFDEPARVVIAGVLVFAAIVLVLHVVRADVDARLHGLSAYAVGPWAGLMTAAFASLAVSLAILVAALSRSVPHLRTTPGLALLALAAASIAVVAACPMESGRVRHRLHLVAAVTFFLASVLGALLTSSALGREIGWEVTGTRAMRLAQANAFALFAFFVGARSGGPLSSSAGLLQRLCFALIILWIVVVARQLMRIS